MSSGEYLVFLDADDRLLPNAVAAGVACFEARRSCGFVFGGFRIINEDGSIRKNVIRRSPSRGLYIELLHSNYILMHGSVMYKRATFEAVGMFETSLPAAEDYDLYLRIARCFPVASYSAIVAEYRQHSSNMSLDSCLMTKATLSVLHSHSGYTTQSNRLQRALREGTSETRTYYTQKLLVQAVTAGGGRAARALLQMYLRRPDIVTTSLLKGLDRYFKLSETVAGVTAYVRRRANRLRQPRYESSFPRRLTPVSREFGFERGTPVDRYFIERFLETNSNVIQGRVLEIGDSAYTRQFGGNRVSCGDILSVKTDAPANVIAADLSSAPNIPSDTYDCIIVTQTLHLIYDFHAAVLTLHRILKPGGVLLVTVPGISPLSIDEWKDTWYWSFTKLSMTRVFDETFGPMVEVEADGNVVAATAFLQGIASCELTPEELTYCDPQFEVLIHVKATKLDPIAHTRSR